MKKIQLLLLLCCLNIAVSAQVSSNYTFSSSSNTYNTTLTGATTLIPSGWSSEVLNVPLPFVFYFDGIGYSSVWVNSNGFITFGPTPPYASTNNPLANNNGFDGSVSAFGLVNPGASAGLVDATNTAANAITYGTQTSGSNTVFVIQWGNAYRYPTRPSTGTDAIKFQIRLIQNTNVVEIMYGACSTNIAYTFTNLWSPVVGLGGFSTADFNNRSRTTAGAWTTTGTSAGVTASDYLLFTSGGSVPASGLTMDWTPISSPTTFSGTPPVTTAIANTGITCGAVSLSLAELPFSTGFTYQWQESSTGLLGSWTNCTGTGNTNASYTETPTAATYYQCLVTGGSGTTASKSIAVGRESSCPTVPTYTYNNWYYTEYEGYGFGLTSFTISSGECGTSLNDIDASVPGYNQGYTTGTCDNYIDNTYLAPIQLYAGNTYTGTLTDGFTNAMNAKVYIDFNDNGVFTDAGEQVASVASIINTSSGNVSITIPVVGSGGYYGLHRMRVRAAYSTTVTSPTANMAIYGMAKDYMVSILPPNQTITPTLASPLCLPVASETLTATTNVSTGTPAVSTYTYTWSGPSAYGTSAISSSNATTFAPTTTSYSGVYTVTTTADGSQACANSTYDLVVATTASAPTAGPTALSISGVNYLGASNITFTPNATAPNGYLIVATNSSTAPTAPANGTTYATGTTGAFGANSIVISGSVYGSAPSYNTNLLTSNSQYFIYIYPFNIACSGPQYYTTSPALAGNSLITCIAPVTTFTASAPTGSTITLNWTAAVNGGNTTTYVNPTTFTYTINAYLDAGLTVLVSGYPATTTSTTYTATGLGVGTAYYFTVTSGAPTATCGTISSTATNTTTCAGSAIVPYIQKFETGSTAGNLSPNCWTGNAGQYGGAGGEYKNGGEFGAPFAPHSGSWYYIFDGNDYLSSATYANQWLESPGFNLSPGQYTFSFWYISNSQWSTIKAEYTTTPGIPSNTTANMPGTYTVIGTPPTNFNAGAWANYTSVITITTAGTYYFGIDAVMGATPVNLNLAIDDIELCTPPNVVASNSGPYCAPSTVTLSSAGTTGALTYAWSGPAGYSSTLANPTAIPGVTAGVYTYTLTGVSDPISAGFSGACSISSTTTVNVNALPTSVAPTSSPNPVCAGSAITLTGNVTGGSGLVYSWSGATTGISSASSVNTTIPSAVAANAGTYILTVTAPVCSGAVTGNTSASPQVVNSLPATVAPTTSPNPVCAGDNIALSGNVTGGAGVVYAWTGPTTGITSASSANTNISSAVAANAGIYTLTATAPGCTGNVMGNTSANPQVVNSLPATVAPTTSPNPVCAGSTITLTGNVTGGSGLVYSWSGQTTGIVSASSANTTIPSAVAANAGTYILTVTAPSCSGSVSGNTSANPQVVNSLPATVAPMASPNPVCAGDNITLSGNVTGGAGVVYAWTGPTTGITSASSANTNIPSAIAANAGSYTLTATAPGCTGNVMGNANASPEVVNALPTSVLPSVSPNPVCVGYPISLTGNVTGGAGLVYSWTGPTTGITSASLVNASIPSAVAANAGTYTLTVTAPGCLSNVNGNTGITPLVVNALPTSVTPTALPNPVCVGNNITLSGNVSGGTALSYSWSGPTTGITSTSSVNTSISSAVLGNAGTYSLTVTAAGCPGNVVGATSPLVVNQLPTTVTASVTPNPACASSAITLSGSNVSGTGVQYAWTGPVTGHILSASSESTGITSAALTDAGVYTLTATAPGCTGSTIGTSSALVVNQLPTTVTASVTPNPTCVGSAITLTGSNVSGTGVQYAWTGPVTGHILSASSESTGITSAALTDAGVYTLTATAPGCASSTVGRSSALVVNQLPTTVTASVTPNPTCVGSAVTLTGSNVSGTGVQYAWTGPVTGHILSASSESTGITSAALTDAGIYTLTATAPGCAGSTIGTSSALVVNQLPTTVTASVTPNPTCVGSAVTLSGSNISGTGVQYAWTGPITGDILSTSSESTGIASAALTDAGVYTLTASAPGCTGTVSGMTASEVVHKLPTTVTATVSPNPACLGNLISLTGGDSGDGVGVTYAWTGPVPADIVSAISESTSITSASVTDDGVYHLTASATGCAGNTVGNSSALVVNTQPVSVAPTTAPNPICAGNTITLTGNVTGGTGLSYSWSGPITGIVNASAVNTTIPSATLANAGTYTLTVTAAGCAPVSGNTGATQQVVNALPVIHTFTGGGAYCAADTGVHVGLTLSDTGISYQLYRVPSTAIGSPVAGTGSAIDFGLYTTVGVYYAIATNTASGCTSYLSGITISINPLPDTFTVTGGGSYCASGSGVHVGLDNSATGISYQLYNSGSPVGSAMTGTGSALDFGLQTGAGVYTVIGSNAITLCPQSMAGSATVTVIPLPTADTVTGGGGYCAGGTGVNVGLNNSTAGTIYQLYNGVNPVGTPDTSAGGALNFGLQTIASMYTVIATNPVTTCVAMMTGTVTVTVNPLPVVYNVTGGGSYCAGGTGVPIGLSGSNDGISYQLYNDGAIADTALLGSGSSFGFGPMTDTGTYWVIATDTTTHCISNMSDSVAVTITPVVVPHVLISTNDNAGDTVCAGFPITFTAHTRNGGATPGYQWNVENLNVGVSDSTYTYVPNAGDVIAVTMISSAACAMPDTVYDTMKVNTEIPLPPSVFINVTPITTIQIGQPDTLTAMATNCGSSPHYQWFVNGIIVPGATNSVYTSNSFVNGDSVTCMVITSGACGGQVTFNSVVITVYPAGVVQIASIVGDMTLIPNPNQGDFTLKGTLSTTADEEVSLEITDMLGQAVYTNNVMAHNGTLNEHIHLSNLANGMYLLNMRSATDNKVFHVVVVSN